MVQSATQSTTQHSRLVNLLSASSHASLELPAGNVADKLGQLFNLAESISLADALQALPQTPFEPVAATSDHPKNAFFKARQQMVEFILKSFVAGTSDAPFKLPTIAGEPANNGALEFEPYQQFYSLHQSEMDIRSQRLRVQTRQAVAGYSKPLAQLAALDQALGNRLAGHSRKIFAAIPRLLQRRFNELQQSAPSIATTAPDSRAAWLACFHTEIQDVLLAELEARLQPTLGLIEALNTEINHHD